MCRCEDLEATIRREREEWAEMRSRMKRTIRELRRELRRKEEEDERARPR